MRDNVKDSSLSKGPALPAMKQHQALAQGKTTQTGGGTTPKQGGGGSTRW